MERSELTGDETWVVAFVEHECGFFGVHGPFSTEAEAETYRNRKHPIWGVATVAFIGAPGSECFTQVY